MVVIIIVPSLFKLSAERCLNVICNQNGNTGENCDPKDGICKCSRDALGYLHVCMEGYTCNDGQCGKLF